MLRQPHLFEACESILREIAQRWQIDILELSVMPEHVHAVVALKPTMTVSKALNLLKGASSHALFEFEPKFRKRYYAGNFGQEEVFTEASATQT